MDAAHMYQVDDDAFVCAWDAIKLMSFMQHVLMYCTTAGSSLTLLRSSHVPSITRFEHHVRNAYASTAAASALHSKGVMSVSLLLISTEAE